MKATHSLKEITSRQNFFVRLARSLKERKARETEKSFILEGRKIMAEVLTSDFNLRFFFVTETEQAKEENHELIDALVNASQSSFLIDETLMRYIADTQHPGGFLAVMETRYANVADLNAEAESLLILDNIQDPGNLGVIFRTASAFKIASIILHGSTVDPYNPKVIRASAGMILKVPFFSLSADDFSYLSALKERGCRFYCTSPGGRLSLFSHELVPPLALVLGNESRGISSELLKIADHTIRIPMEPGIDSLNVSIIAAILCYKYYESTRGR